MKHPSARSTVWLLALLFVAPVLLAIAWHLAGQPWRPAHTVNHGTLVTPPRPLPEAALPWRGHFERAWTLVQPVEGPACDRTCQETLVLTRQVRLTFGRDMELIRRVAVVSGDPARTAGIERTAHPDLVFVAAEPVLRAWFESAASGATVRLYLVDPMGNLMMYYPRDVAPRDLQADLKRLLKLSKDWLRP
ncbi:MAG TPA: hypothetical protein VNL72_04120 [Gammaproteobacteria bacterium]|nr:hypothetical protein [Gammaproteobacteria bacterium]